MKIVDEIIAARKYGVIHCGISKQVTPTLSTLAEEFGLDGNAEKYRENDTESARRLAQSILNRDMAYDAEILSADRAKELVDKFLVQFDDEKVRFYTNGSFHLLASDPERQGLGNGWNPVTAATFDTGILILGPKHSGCLWVEDED